MIGRPNSIEFVERLGDGRQVASSAQDKVSVGSAIECRQPSPFRDCVADPSDRGRSQIPAVTRDRALALDPLKECDLAGEVENASSLIGVKIELRLGLRGGGAQSLLAPDLKAAAREKQRRGEGHHPKNSPKVVDSDADAKEAKRLGFARQQVNANHAARSRENTDHVANP